MKQCLKMCYRFAHELVKPKRLLIRQSDNKKSFYCRFLQRKRDYYNEDAVIELSKPSTLTRNSTTL